MKALSIQQPYAFAVTHGFKPVENRDWRPNNPGLRFRGPVLIHTGLRELSDDVDSVMEQIADQTGESLDLIMRGYQSHRALGAIVGAATIVDCVTEHPSLWFNGPYAFVLADAVWSGPEVCKGQLGFFDPPPEVIRNMRVRLAGGRYATALQTSKAGEKR